MNVKSLSAVLGCLCCGCVNLHMESREDMVSDKTRYEPVEVKVDDFAGIDPHLVRTEENRGRFSLVCTGRYRIVRRRISDVERAGRHSLSVGLFPGIWWMSEAVDGTDYSEWPLAGVKIVLANCAAGLPTILSLFYEPFDSYHDEKCGFWSAAAGYGLLGCCKRSQWKPWTWNFTESQLETAATESYPLSDYTVVISGNPYRCAADAKDVSVSIPGGERTVNAQIESVPSLRGKLGHYVSSLKGLELEVEVQTSR